MQRHSKDDDPPGWETIEVFGPGLTSEVMTRLEDLGLTGVFSTDTGFIGGGGPASEHGAGSGHPPTRFPPLTAGRRATTSDGRSRRRRRPSGHDGTTGPGSCGHERIGPQLAERDLVAVGGGMVGG